MLEHTTHIHCPHILCTQCLRVNLPTHTQSMTHSAAARTKPLSPPSLPALIVSRASSVFSVLSSAMSLHGLSHHTCSLATLQPPLPDQHDLSDPSDISDISDPSDLQILQKTHDLGYPVWRKIKYTGSPFRPLFPKWAATPTVFM